MNAERSPEQLGRTYPNWKITYAEHLHPQPRLARRTPRRGQRPGHPEAPDPPAREEGGHASRAVHPVPHQDANPEPRMLTQQEITQRSIKALTERPIGLAWKPSWRPSSTRRARSHDLIAEKRNEPAATGRAAEAGRPERPRARPGLTGGGLEAPPIAASWRAARSCDVVASGGWPVRVAGVGLGRSGDHASGLCVWGQWATRRATGVFWRCGGGESVGRRPPPEGALGGAGEGT